MMPTDYNCIIQSINKIDYSAILHSSYFTKYIYNLFKVKSYNITRHFRRPFHWGTRKLMSACENPTLYALSKRKARKQHQCCECRGKIEVGEVYNYHRGVWDSSWYVFKVCDDCDKLRMVVDAPARMSSSYDELTAFTELGESISSCSDVHLVREFIRIKEKRGVEVPKYLITLYDKLANEEDVKAEEITELIQDEL